MCVGEEQRSVERAGFIPGAGPDTKGHRPGNRVVLTSRSGRPRRQTSNPEAGGAGFRKHWSTTCGDAGIQAGDAKARSDKNKPASRRGAHTTKDPMRFLEELMPHFPSNLD